MCSLFAGLLQWRMLSLFQAKLVFSWARVRARSDRSDKSEKRLRCLGLEDFLEAVVRLATMVALPTDEDIKAMEAEDAADYLHALQLRAQETGGAEDEAWCTFLKERKQARAACPSKQKKRRWC